MNEGRVDKFNFFKDIVKLSYMGDVRTYFKAEKKDKIDSIVHGAYEEYISLYSNFFEKYKFSNESEYIEINKESIFKLYDNIPRSFLNDLKIKSGYFISDFEFKVYFINKLSPIQRRKLIENYIKQMNLKYSCSAILTGLYSSNITKIVK
jgi:hypothetical protein